MHIKHHGEVEAELGKISCIYNVKSFCEHVIATVQIMTMYRDDVDAWDEQRWTASIVSNDQHSKVMAEEHSRKWNIGIQTAKDTLSNMMQQGIRMAVHPMMRRV